ncbi:MAG: HlyD family efflux transporter periplasmic adaptor subunit [Deltaproteobacteria bacterium]|nr:HlyD family efflux transporter periplasmic adaptor subunit [Deltaproteobacteria bacterium]
MYKKNEPKSKNRILFRVIMVFSIIFVAILTAGFIMAIKKPPPQMPHHEPSIQVEVLDAKPENIPVTITGYGEVKVLNEVSIAPEVSGKIVKIHPRLEEGEVISKNEVIFQIDTRDYEAAYIEAKATVTQMKNSLERMKRQYEIDKERLITIQRTCELAKQQYERIKQLFEEDKVGTQSGVDQAEQTYNNSKDQREQMEKTVELYPLQIEEAESSLLSAESRRETAKLRFERCTVKAPFDGRIKSESIEKGQYVSPGMSVITLADDSVLEIQVPLDSRDANKWLPFDENNDNTSNAWVKGLKQVKCKVRWTESKSASYWEGILNRVVKFDEQTRTVTVAVRITGAEALSINHGSLPLVEGMFCAVAIPGKTLENVYRIPRWAVSFENTVYVAVDDKLITIPVEIARSQGEEAYISEGLKPGDRVITTRLVDPMENTRLLIL